MAFVSWLSVSPQLEGFSWPWSSFMLHKRTWIELEFRPENNAARTREEAIFNYFWLRHIEPMKAFFFFFWMISFPGDYMLIVTKADLCWIILENQCWWNIMVVLSICVLLENLFSGLCSSWHYCKTQLLKKLNGKAWALSLAKSWLFHGLRHQEALGLSLQCTNCHYLLLKHVDWLLPASGGSECWRSFLPSPHAISVCFDCWHIEFGLFHSSCDHAQLWDPLPVIRKGDKGLHLYLCLCSKIIVFSFIPVLLLCVALSLLTTKCP